MKNNRLFLASYEIRARFLIEYTQAYGQMIQQIELEAVHDILITFAELFVNGGLCHSCDCHSDLSFTVAATSC